VGTPIHFLDRQELLPLDGNLGAGVIRRGKHSWVLVGVAHAHTQTHTHACPWTHVHGRVR
jgi:hypothetical protein